MEFSDTHIGKTLLFVCNDATLLPDTMEIIVFRLFQPITCNYMEYFVLLKQPVIAQCRRKLLGME